MSSSAPARRRGRLRRVTTHCDRRNALSNFNSPRPGPRRLRSTLIGSCVIAAAVSGCAGAPGASPAVRSTPAARGFSSAVHASAKAGLGASFNATDASGGTYRVRLDLIIDPATAAGRPVTLKHGRRLVGVVFTIDAISGRLRHEDAGRLATVVGSDGKTYRPGDSSIAGYAASGTASSASPGGPARRAPLPFRCPAGSRCPRCGGRPRRDPGPRSPGPWDKHPRLRPRCRGTSQAAAYSIMSIGIA